MRWLADECVAAFVVAHLRDGGHDVLYVAEADPSASDSDIVGLADREQRLLLTEDKDFGELVFRWHRAAPRHCSVTNCFGEARAEIAAIGGCHRKIR